MTEPKTPCEQLVHDMISGGARRVEAGETVRLPSGIAVTLRTGHGAVLGNRLVTTGAVETTRCERGQVAALVREAAG